MNNSHNHSISESILDTWLAELKEIWLEKKRAPEFCDYLVKNVFTYPESNPFEAALDLAEKCPDFACNKTNGMAACVLKEFDSWLQTQNYSHQQENTLISQSLKLRVFQSCTSHHTALIDHIFRVYHLGKVLIVEFKKFFWP